MPRGGKKATKVELEQRLVESTNKIMDDLLGWTAYTTWAMEKYHINRDQANTYWNACWERINEHHSQTIEASVTQTIMDLERQKEQARVAGDRRTELEITKYINKIKGGETERVEVKGNIDHTLKYSFGDVLPPRDEQQ